MCYTYLYIYIYNPDPAYHQRLHLAIMARGDFEMKATAMRQAVVAVFLETSTGIIG